MRLTHEASPPRRACRRGRRRRRLDRCDSRAADRYSRRPRGRRHDRGLRPHHQHPRMGLMTAEIVSPPLRRHVRGPIPLRRPLVGAAAAPQAAAPSTARSAAALLGAELEELTRDELIALVPEPWVFERMVPPSLFARMIRKGLTVRVLHGPARAGEPAPFPALARMGTAAPTTF